MHDRQLTAAADPVQELGQEQLSGARLAVDHRGHALLGHLGRLAEQTLHGGAAAHHSRPILGPRPAVLSPRSARTL